MAVVFLIGISHQLDDLFARVIAVHHRHLKVHEDELVGAVGALAGLLETFFEHFESLFAVKSEIGLYLEEMIDQNLEGH